MPKIGEGMSLTARFDDLCRLSKFLIENSSDQEFVLFARNQEECRTQWLQSELEVERTLSLGTKHLEEKNLLETKLKHCRNMLAQEIEKKRNVEQERDNLFNQLNLIKEIITDSNVVNEMTRQKLAFLNDPGLQQAITSSKNVDESVGSILSPSDIDLTDEDSTPARKNDEERKRRSSLSPICEDKITKKFKINKENIVTIKSQLKPVKRTAPSPPIEPPIELPKTQRSHDFIQKTNIKPEKCLTCCKRIHFGKKALRCSDCKMICHIQCKEQSPSCTRIKDLQECIISDFAPSAPPFIPELIVHCVMQVESRGLNVRGIYRESGSETEKKMLLEKFVNEKTIPKLMNVDIHSICCCMKNFLRSLKEPLVTYKLWQSFVNAAEDDNNFEKNCLQTLIQQLPQTNRDTLAYLIMHLQLVAKSPLCKMPASSLARLFGPTIVGYSSSDPAAMMQETHQQAQVVKRLLEIPQDFWSKFINILSDEQGEKKKVYLTTPTRPSVKFNMKKTCRKTPLRTRAPSSDRSSKYFPSPF